MFPIDHPPNKASILPVHGHLSLHSSQFLASAICPNHTYFPVVSAYPGLRSIKFTLQSCFLPSISTYLHDNQTTLGDYRCILMALQMFAMTQPIAAGQDPNSTLALPQVQSTLPGPPSPSIPLHSLPNPFGHL